MSTPVTITDLVLGNPNSTEDVKIKNNFANIKAWIATPALGADDIASNAITSAKIADSAVNTSEIAALAVTTDKLAVGAVSTTKIAAGGVTTDRIASGNVATDTVADVAVSRAKIRTFTVPKLVSVLPPTLSGTISFSNTTPVTSIVYTVSASSLVPQVGQAVSGIGITADTVVTAVTGSVSPFTLTLNRPTSQSSSSGATTVEVKPTEGDEVFYIADATAGVNWHLRYNSASSSTHKWEYVGGAPVSPFTSDATGSALSSATTTYALPGSGNNPISTTFPLAGDYDVTFGVYVNLTGTTSGYTGVGSTAPGDESNAVVMRYDGSGMRSQRITGRTANQALNMYHHVDSGASGSSTFKFRFIRITPVRVSA